MPDDDREDELRAHQDGRVYPLGRALRATYGADNHDSLGTDVTGLMIDLSKVPYDASEEIGRPAETRPPPPAPRSWRDRIGELLSGRRHPA